MIEITAQSKLLLVLLKDKDTTPLVRQLAFLAREELDATSSQVCELERLAQELTGDQDAGLDNLVDHLKNQVRGAPAKGRSTGLLPGSRTNEAAGHSDMLAPT